MTERERFYAADIMALERKLEEKDKEIRRLANREGKAEIELSYNDGVNPFAGRTLEVADFGVADNYYVVTDPEGEKKDKRIKELEEELRGYRAIEKDNRDHCRNPLSMEETNGRS